ncbi:MAG: class I SAM-dependent methyltransferase [Candidatus Lernaella stagnicola]|nr:class I SAM-dependent methyltransferase [Candidatus Lernaella stagnicola]
MKINAAEKLMINNPARALMLRLLIGKMVSWTPGRNFVDVGEIGCGPGNGLTAIDKVLRPKRLFAFDLDERMVEIAQKRARSIRATLDLRVAAAENIPWPDESLDAVFEMTIFHHVPDWRAAVAEVVRVLRPGGVFFFEELTREYHFDVPVLSFIQQKFTVHPWDTIPDRATFLAEIENGGLQLVHQSKFLFDGWVLGAARKPE